MDEEPREIGDWIMISELGSGAFGVVKLWKNQKTNEYFAVKKCRFKMASQLSKRQKERWTNEVTMMKSITNDNIVSFKDLPDDLHRNLSKWNPTNLPILSMEYCRKGNLRHCFHQPQNLKGLSETEVRCVLGDLCNAVSYLHSVNVTHRDIKPENIVLDECNERPNKTIYKLIDLGYAKELETLDQSFVGTLHYLAPEIFETENYNSKVDYWSLGIVAFEVITGVHPFLHQLPPAERFRYIKNKSPDIISMHVSTDSKVKSSSQIIFENHIGQVFKTLMESWLMLMLQYNPDMRGVRGGQESVDVFHELRTILSKKIVRVLSVYDFECRSYEIRNDTTISEMKKLIERDLNIPEGDQVLLMERFRCNYDHSIKIKDCFSEINHETTIYVFKKDECVKVKVIALPEQMQFILDNGQKKFPPTFRIQLNAFSLHFISQEKELLTAWIAAFQLQINYVEFLFKEEMQLFLTVRNSVEKLAVQIECLDKINRKFMDVVDIKNDKCSQNLIMYRKYLRQAKELLENVNSLTERHLRLSKKKTAFQKVMIDLESFLNKTELNQAYSEALKLFSCGSVQDMSKILSNVIKVKFQIPKSAAIKNYLSTYWKLMATFQKRFTWMEALGKELDEISNCICQNASDKCDLMSDKTAEVETAGKVRVSFSKSDNENYSTDHLIKENVQLRYEIQDLVNNALVYHKYNVNQVPWNGIKQAPSNEEIYTNCTF